MESLKDQLLTLEPNKVAWVNKNSIYLYDVAQLHKLKEIANNHNYDSPVHYFTTYKDVEPVLNELTDIFHEMFVEIKSGGKLAFDITEVGGIGASKSNLMECGSIAHFVERYCRPYFKVTKEELKKNLAHSEIRIISQEKTNDNIRVFGWKDCLYLSNSGGSHHFATALYIASELNIPVPLQANFSFITIEPDAVRKFNAAYKAILIPNHDFAYICSAVSSLNVCAVAYQLPQYASADATLLIYRKGAVESEIENHLTALYTDFNNELLKFYYVQQENQKLRKFLKVQSDVLEQI
ncbi:hypothetical protein HYG89_05035 [Acinetobacter sp. SwsAc5]|uniref:DUF6685 family protein n=1 Tax=Acinetobacter sp. SwsAc5 TaxID=2749438 RepID=UPI0015BD68E1|nr:DUF6685 family protein [Acinetobacter sp. SwsAc5]NWK51931.1 hypothetical protein [Acinetobacter sp. SwsAc5]